MNIAIPPAPDYNDATFWAWTPDRDNPPALRQADVFFSPGTQLSGRGPEYLDVHDPRLRKLADRPRLAQASAFAKAGAIYQPQIRQASMELNRLPRGEVEAVYRVPYMDTHAAFLHYLREWNRGRPFFLVGHSQGAVLLLELMKRVFANPAVASRLVAAYIIGFSVTPADMAAHEHMRLASGPDDTGVIITYNTLARDGDRAWTLLPGALCVNPLNWVHTPEYAPASLHLGRVDFDDQGRQTREIPHCTDAWIDPALGALRVGAYGTADTESGSFFPPGDLHRMNINLFYRNLEENAVRRLNAFMEKSR